MLLPVHTGVPPIRLRETYFIDTLRRLPAFGSPSLHPATKAGAASYPGAELTLFGFGAGTVGAPPPGRVHRLASGQTLGIKPAIMGVSCSLEASAIAVGRRVSDGLRRAVDRLLPTIRDMEITKPAHGLAGILPSMGLSSRSEEHTSELQSLMRISYAVFCLKKKKTTIHT